MSAEVVPDTAQAADLPEAAEMFAEAERPKQPGRLLSWLWPKLLAVGLVLGIWQVVVWSGWKPDYVLAGPADVFPRFWDDLGINADAAATTLQSAVVGFAIALLVGTVVALLLVLAFSAYYLTK